MKFIIDNWMLITVAFVSGAMLVWPAVSRGTGAGTVNPTGAVNLINREKAVVVDVCEPDEFAKGHLPQAHNIPFGQLEEKLPALVKDKALPVILVCASGARSGRAVGLVKKLGYEKAHSLAGGMGAWKEANLPIQKA